MTARRVLGFCLALLGRLEEGRGQLEARPGLFRRDEHGGLVLRFGQDPRIAAMSVLAWIACLQGDREGERPACRPGHIGRARARPFYHGLRHLYRRCGSELSSWTTPGEAPSPRCANRAFHGGGFPVLERHSASGSGRRLAAREGRTAEARALASESSETSTPCSVYWFRPFIFASLAEGFLHAGDPG